MIGPKVRLSYGTIRGTTVNNIHCFKGIPYAAPPVGDLRWRPPAPPIPWTGEREMTQFGHSAMQGSLGAPALREMGEMIGIAAGPIDENCLTLNVWTGHVTDEESPVMVWIHGGGNVVGSSAQPRFNGEYFVQRGGIVLVTINYRLGAFGFLHSPELGATGNEGLLDQIAALRWVRKEIRKFGGNPKDVTVFGQSAGGMDITQMMGMEAAAGCFDRAIPMSGVLTPQIPREEAAATAARFAGKFGGYEALRSVPAQQILDHQQALTAGQLGGGVRFGSVRDGQVIREDASVAIGAGTFTKGMPLLLGTARDEWGLWTGMDPAMRSLDEAGLEKLARRPFGDRVRDGIQVYRDARLRRGVDASPVALWRAIMTDSMFRIPAIRMAELHSQHTKATWMYLFDYESPALDGQLGACHSIDVPFVFGTTGVGELARFCGDSHLVRCLSEIIHDTYVAFGKYGNPSNIMFDWPEYERVHRRTMHLDMRSRVEDAPMEEERAFWDSLATG